MLIKLRFPPCLFRNADLEERGCALAQPGSASRAMASSASLETMVPPACPRAGASPATSKTLAFSIERIMAKTSEPRAPFEPRPAALEADSSQSKKLLNLCSPLPCMIPLQPLGYEVPSKTLLSYSEFWKSSLRAGGGGGGGSGGGAPVCGASGLCKTNCGVCCKAELGLAPSALPAGRVIKPQVINQAVGLPASGSLYYFNYLDSTAYPPSELLGSHLFPSGLLNAQAPTSLAAHPKLFLLENAKLASLTADKFPHPAPYPHKERLPAPLEQVLKENSALTADRGVVKSHNKLPGGSTDSKPKNFTCEVCGKVRPKVLGEGASSHLLSGVALYILFSSSGALLKLHTPLDT